MQRIVVDWGTTNFRAYLIDEHERIAERRIAPRGVHNCEGNYSNILREFCGDWQSLWPDIPVYLCGMIGSRTGWYEVPYVASPAPPDALFRGLLPIPGEHNVFMIPGMRCLTPAGIPDVMRGEECQVLGAISETDNPNTLVILPGTHSKWVRVQDGCIHDFATFFTGEMYALLHHHSSIGAVLDPAHHHHESFQHGLSQSTSAGGLLNQIFSARTRTLCEDTSGQSMSAYLSGILIGSEFIHGRKLFDANSELLLIGDEPLATLYQLAATFFDLKLRTLDPARAVTCGIARICAAGTVNNPVSGRKAVISG
ncbi:2-dehydro-3-deoxygalactonokinase [Microbulbifer harenosus]|uniref:2-dehydro-3-deoxygalactonokinase n=1 Tax=Microbulbifer harenosus TaxID=2576840 RepID=A0ABY2UE54_9GAMM|nr:2-dehydro-3-deoxygalactonokinase [Microbulbifer harenosus]TLM75228.1 2-dehydro-3-deoxygalactonokinase [Microbulbifer harenosus]